MKEIGFRTFGYIGLGVYNDIRKRIPYYLLDFTDAYNYRVIPSTVFVFFTNILPAIAFAQDMFDKTDNLYGVNEVLLSSAVGGIVFGLAAGQPLCIVGVTGPVAIFSYTVYELMVPRGTPYFPFMCWIYLWSMIMHFVIALTNFVSFLKIISAFSCEAFGFFICIVYIQKGIQILNRQFAMDDFGAGGFLSVIVALLMTMCGLGSFIFGLQLHYFKPWIRKVFVDYGTPLAVIFFTGFTHFGGFLNVTHLNHLPTTTSFQPTLQPGSFERPHGWFIHFWPTSVPNDGHISVGDIFLAVPFAILLTFLFYFDHNVSSIMCLLKEYPFKKPATFHWDFALLGITTGVAGLIGIPPPNGLIPQAPLHTASLVVHDPLTGKPLSVVEQRVTNTAQGILTVVLMTSPFLTVLGLIPQAVLAGLFFIMGIIGLHQNNVTNGIRYIFMEDSYVANDPSCPQIFRRIRAIENKKWYYVYLFLQTLAGCVEFGITDTKAAIGFPGVLMFFTICAKWVWPYIIPQEELDHLDHDVADIKIIENLDISKVIKQYDSKNKYKEDIESLPESELPDDGANEIADTGYSTDK